MAVSGYDQHLQEKQEKEAAKAAEKQAEKSAAFGGRSAAGRHYSIAGAAAAPSLRKTDTAHIGASSSSRAGEEEDREEATKRLGNVTLLQKIANDATSFEMMDWLLSPEGQESNTNSNPGAATRRPAAATARSKSAINAGGAVSSDAGGVAGSGAVPGLRAAAAAPRAGVSAKFLDGLGAVTVGGVASGNDGALK